MTPADDAPASGTADVPCVQHFCIVLYPFLFAHESYEDVIGRLLAEPRWRLDLSVTLQEQAPRARYFLPYARQILFPELSMSEAERAVFPPDKIFAPSDSGESADSPGSRSPPSAAGGTSEPRPFPPQGSSLEKQKRILLQWPVVRWNYRIPANRATVWSSTDRYPFRMRRVTMAVYPTGVGILAMEAKLERDVVTVAGLREFASTLSSLGSKFRWGRQGQRQGSTQAVSELIANEFLNCISALVEPGSRNMGEGKLFRYHFFSVRLEQEMLPAVLAEFLGTEPVAGSRISSLGSASWSFSKSGAVVAATSGRLESVLYYAWRGYYFDLFTHALMHRLSFLHFYTELSKIEELLGSKAQVAKTRLRLLQFTNKFWFGQLTNVEYGHYLWERWQQVMETQDLYAEVKAQVQELDGYLQAQYESRRALFMNVLSLFVTPLGFAWAILSAFARSEEVSLSLSTALFTSVAFAAFVWLLAARFTRPFRKPAGRFQARVDPGIWRPRFQGLRQNLRIKKRSMGGGA